MLIADSDAGRVALVDIDGRICTDPTQGIPGPCALIDVIAHGIRAARDDEAVVGTILRVNSPGGEVLRLAHVIDAVESHRAVKPIVAWIDGKACSAGYWPAALCHSVWAASDADWVGSIGVVVSLVDTSEEMTKLGRRFDHVTSRENKTDGYPGTAIDDGVRERFRELMQPADDRFVADVAFGRGISEESIRELEGRVISAREGVRVGLVDEIVSGEQVVARFAAVIAALATQETTP